MGKGKSGGLAKLPKDQKCHFLIGPVSSWFMPNTTDIWTPPSRLEESQASGDNLMKDSDNLMLEDNTSLSFFVYGSIGCFCYGEIHHRTRTHRPTGDIARGENNSVSGLVERLIVLREDNSRVSCIRFQKQSHYPIVVALTENGSLVIHDCLKGENLIQLNKSEIFTKYLGLSGGESNSSGDQSVKRVKYAVEQQINSISWPNKENLFMGISLISLKTCFILRLKVKDLITSSVATDPSFTKDVFVEKSEKIELDLKFYASPICLVESTMLDDNTCLIATAMDDGFIIVIVYDLVQGQKKRLIELPRHEDQVCSMSLNVDNRKKFPLGLLASVDRDGKMRICDIENEFYFADYKAIDDGDSRSSNTRINWFALRFIRLPGEEPLFIAISNQNSGVTILEVPKNNRSKSRLMDKNPVKRHQKKHQEQNVLKHNALIFNIEYEPITKTLISSSLDGNHILWSLLEERLIISNQESIIMKTKPQFLIPAMLNNAKVHMLRSSPIREDVVCSALGKAGIRFFKISNNVMDCKFDMSPSCSLLARKISKANVTLTSISWHPAHEYRLAIGTLEGKVFRADITPGKAALTEAEYRPLTKNDDDRDGAKPESSFMNIDEVFGVEYTPIEREVKQEFSDRKQRPKQHQPPGTDGIYSLCWGPNPTSPQDVTKYAIYAVSSVSHRLFILCNPKDKCEKLTNYLDEFRDVSLPEAMQETTEVSWKSSMDLMALGTIDGRILILSYLDESHEGRSNRELFKRVAVIQGHDSLGSSFIQCLAWHPTTDKNDPYYYYLAASSKESQAFIYNLKESILVAKVKQQLKLEHKQSDAMTVEDGGPTSESDMIGGLTVLSAYVNKLDAHKKTITDIAWSPHEPNQLATASFDRMSYVWSVDNSFMEAKLVSKFSARDRLFTLDWSLVDTDLLFTSGHDSTIWAWRPSENILKANL